MSIPITFFDGYFIYLFIYFFFFQEKRSIKIAMSGRVYLLVNFFEKKKQKTSMRRWVGFGMSIST